MSSYIEQSEELSVAEFKQLAHQAIIEMSNYIEQSEELSGAEFKQLAHQAIIEMSNYIEQSEELSGGRAPDLVLRAGDGARGDRQRVPLHGLTTNNCY